ncbi:MAG: DUF512 domain-containing protein [Clostridia bacterium]|nr:DUF512 domain-containing protein [Clostridia bacterium]
MSVQIKSVIPRSPADKAGIMPGDSLKTINDREIRDVLDFDFYSAEKKLSLLLSRNGERYRVEITKGEYAPLGLEFETFLMDRQRHCANQCIFCFVDQLPAGMRESLYFKDDDVRLSFLMGNYVTMTNFTRRDVDRIMEMHISPINISVHTTDPELRVKMLGNKNAGKVLAYMDEFKEAGIKMNAQVVICPGWNDGQALERTLHDLIALAPEVESIALVPVGLTGHREGLCEIPEITPENAKSIIETAEKWNGISLGYTGAARVYPADELFLKAGMEIPGEEYYGEYPQLENGVGMLALLRDSFRKALSELYPEDKPTHNHLTVATGEAAGPMLRTLAAEFMARFPEVRVDVVVVKNDFFGGGVTVAGLLTGQDLKMNLQGRDNGDFILISVDTQKSGEAVFLDDMTLSELSESLGTPVLPVDNDGAALLWALLDPENN